MSTDPASADKLGDRLAVVHLDDGSKKNKTEDLQELIARTKADIAEQEGDAWESLEARHGLQVNLVLRRSRDKTGGRIVSAEEVERLIATPGSLSQGSSLALMTSFEYEPLPPGYFRLLTIRGVGDFPEVEIEAVPMDGAPEYAAVSYAWGGGVSSRTFLCDGRNFAVSAHVLDLLNHLGLAWQDHKIWIDAICINQADGAEKAVQVAAMRDVYYNAEKVIVWLGANEDESEMVLQNMEAFLEWGLQVRRTGFTPEQEEWPRLNPPPDSLCRALGRFLTRAWFHRVWVVQEMLLAKEALLVCGNRFVDWDVFCRAVLLMSENGLGYMLANVYGVMSPMVSVAIANLGELDRLFQKRRESLSAVDFIKLLKMGRFRKVTEQVDRVYGFLGLVDEELRVAAAPFINYSPESKRDYWKAYANIAKLLLQRDPELHLLSTVPSRNRPPSMPSWCPDYSAAGLSGTSIQEARNGNYNFHAGYVQSTQRVTNIEFGPDPYTLKLKGFRLDKVDKVITVNFMPFSGWEEERIQNATRENLAQWEKQCLALARATIKQGPSRPHFLDVHWRTLSFDQMADQPNEVVRQAYLNFRHWASQTHAQFPRGLSAEAKRMAIRFIDKIGFSCSRAYFSTVGGRLGLGPRNMAVGDLVCIVYGAKVPYILRSRRTGTKVALVGDSYVDGAMYGESLNDGMVSEVFSIN
ncbi:HET-domain-containing protein [Stipitochalara longipes BDJ]|nr:HET-domain-containing protein [Stipitochalara longipes BDJ]